MILVIYIEGVGVWIVCVPVNKLCLFSSLYLIVVNIEANIGILSVYLNK